MPRPAATPPAGLDPLAEPLHRNALHLLRLVRREDEASGLSAARLSALSVLVFGGPCSLGALAAAEQVSAPTMTRLVQGLEAEGLVRRAPDPQDARLSPLVATAAAVRLLHAGRDRRLRALGGALKGLSAAQRSAIEQALPALDTVVTSLRTKSIVPTARTGRRRHD